MFAGRHHAKVAPVDLFTGLRVREKAIVRIIPGFESRTRRATLTTAERFGTREHLRIANNHHFPPHTLQRLRLPISALPSAKKGKTRRRGGVGRTSEREPPGFRPGGSVKHPVSCTVSC